MLRLESITLMISSKLLMLNGILYMKNLIKLLIQVLKLYFQIYLSVILQLNILRIKIFSALEECRKMISEEWEKQLAPYSKPRFMD